MNYTGFLDYLSKVAGAHKMVHTTTIGDVYNEWNNKGIKYGACNIDLQNVTDVGSTRIYNIILYYADRLLQDYSNTSQVQDDAFMVLRQIINYVRTNASDIYINDNDNIQYLPFTQKFADVLGGAYCTVQFRVTNPLGNCDFEYEGPIIEPIDPIVHTSVLDNYYTKPEVDAKIGEGEISLVVNGKEAGSFSVNEKENKKINIDVENKAVWGEIDGKIWLQKDLMDIVNNHAHNIDKNTQAIEDLLPLIYAGL